MKDTITAIDKELLMEVLNKALDSGTPVTITVQIGNGSTVPATRTSLPGLMKEIGLREDFAGFACAIDAVELIVAEPDRATRFCEQVLDYVGVMHNVSGKSIEHRIRHAVESAFTVEVATDLRRTIFPQYLSGGKSRPTVKQFIMCVAGYIQENGIM